MPSITFDGRYILYRERDPSSIRFRLFDRQTEANQVLEEFSVERRAAESRISPDGALIAYLTLTAGNLWKVHVRERQGGTAREIAKLDGVGLAWTPDSNSLAMTSRPEEGGPVSVYLIHQLYGNQWRVTHPPAENWGDIDVAASPDGIHFAVARYATRGDGDVWLLSWDGNVQRRLTHLRTWINGLSFTTDGREIVFCPVIKQMGQIYRISTGGGPPTAIPTPGVTNAKYPRIAVNSLVFADENFVSRLYRSAIDGQGTMNLRPVTALNENGTHPVHAQDGRSVAWIQGNGIWISRNGATPEAVVRREITMRDLAWSPDGRYFAVTEAEGHNLRIQIADVSTGRVRRLTRDEAGEARAVWSASGKYIYWRSERGGGRPAYYRRRWPDSDSETEQVSAEGTEGMPSADDRYFYYIDNDQRSPIRQIAVGENGNPRILENIPPVRPGQWFIRGKDVFFGNSQETGETTPIYRAPVDGGRPEVICRLPVHGEGLMDFTLSTDLKEIVWNRFEQTEDIWMIEGFR